MLSRMSQYFFPPTNYQPENIVEKNIDIRTHPLEPRNPRNKRITLGDLHGNGLKFIHSLIQEGIMTLADPKQYQEIVHIYDAHSTRLVVNHPKTVEDLNRFEEIIASATLKAPGLLCLIGDETADRGQNDWFILLILEKLDKNKIPFEITLSNHATEFFRNYFNDTLKSPWSGLRHQAISLTNLGKLLSIDPLILGKNINVERAKDIVKNHYLPHIKLLSYSSSPAHTDPKLHIYTHAPVGMETIHGISKALNVPYRTGTIKELCHTIDMINKNAASDWNRILRIISSEAKKIRGVLGREAISREHPFLRLTWNHAINDVYLVTQPFINFIHGHSGPNENKKSKTHINLDSYLGKTNDVKIEQSKTYAYRVLREPYHNELTHENAPLKQLSEHDLEESRLLKSLLKPKDEPDSSDSDDESLDTTSIMKKIKKLEADQSIKSYRQRELIGATTGTALFFLLYFTNILKTENNEWSNENWLQLASTTVLGSLMGAFTQFVKEYKENEKDKIRKEELKRCFDPIFGLHPPLIEKKAIAEVLPIDNQPRPAK